MEIAIQREMRTTGIEEMVQNKAPGLQPTEALLGKVMQC